MTDVNGTDGNTGNHLKYIPTMFNYIDTTGSQPNTEFSKSIRIGDGCAEGGTFGVSLLNYDMKVTVSNAMLYLYYAIVAEAPTHGQGGNPTFIIRVMKKNAAGQWTQISDTLAYYISATPSTNTTNACPPMAYAQVLPEYTSNGWHSVSVSGSSVYYKDWAKVAINLGNYIYDTVRVQALIYDCSAEFHWAYAYIAGECRPMELKTEGCPAGLSTDVTTISAPRGMRRYEWSASEYGVSIPANDAAPGRPNGYFTFRTLNMPQGTPHVAGRPAVGPEDSIFVSGGRRDTVHYYDYHVQASDFHVTYRPVGTAGVFTADPDSMGNYQTFRCRMTSALDPDKPFQTSLYVNVQNKKPTMSIDTLSLCDGTVRLWNLSNVPGAPNLVVDSTTTWTFYNHLGSDGLPFGDADTVMMGDSVDFQAQNTDERYVLVHTNTTDPACYSEAIYAIHPLELPKPGMTINPRVLCDSATTTIVDTTSSVYRRTWRFLKESYDGPLEGLDYSTMTGQIDSVRGYLTDNRTVTRGFSHSLEPIELTVWNGNYYLNRTNQSDTIWCYATARDTVAVFVHPNLEVTGDTIVCEGSYTDATVRTLGVDGCSYEWSLTPGTVTGNIPAGDHLVVVPYADTSVYYVKVTSPQGCVAWGSVNAYYVQPRVTMFPPEGQICPGDTVLLMGSMADHYTWTATPSDPSLTGHETDDAIAVVPSRSTVYTMVGHGSNDCDASPLTKAVTVIPYPTPAISTSPNYVDSDDPTVVLTNVSPYAVTTNWRFYDGQTSQDRSLKHTFDEAYAGQDSVVYVELTTSNSLGCTSDSVFTIPVHLFTAWLPTIFTPGSEDVNSKFRLYTINEYEYFHIYIYNREGMLVYESEDPAFEWDGTRNGTPCPQGAYVYVCNYRKPNVGTLSNRKGTITLVR